MGAGLHTENIALVEPIGGNYYSEVSSNGPVSSIKGWQTG